MDAIESVGEELGDCSLLEGDRESFTVHVAVSVGVVACVPLPLEGLPVHVTVTEWFATVRVAVHTNDSLSADPLCVTSEVLDAVNEKRLLKPVADPLLLLLRVWVHTVNVELSVPLSQMEPLAALFTSE